MAKMVFTEQFIDDLDTIWSSRVYARVRRVLAMIEQFPECGSRSLPSSIEREFGNTVRKCAVGPFDVLYDYDASEDVAYVLGLVSQRSAE
ncbi:MAG: type II toxin-antitoxin system RelE/ParE family toxin [Coriobacteriaceae bacterium]|nr:type II toxin-antitoxin system RelE/ParE family toxin [Coriobacteriaceae bacterium]